MDDEATASSQRLVQYGAVYTHTLSLSHTNAVYSTCMRGQSGWVGAPAAVTVTASTK